MEREALIPFRTAILVLSDGVAAGTRTDACIPAIAQALGDGFAIVHTRVLADDPAALQAELIDLCDRERVALVVTSGGTGLGPRDRTPQATAAILDYRRPRHRARRCAPPRSPPFPRRCSRAPWPACAARR